MAIQSNPLNPNLSTLILVPLREITHVRIFISPSRWVASVSPCECGSSRRERVKSLRGKLGSIPPEGYQSYHNTSKIATPPH